MCMRERRTLLLIYVSLGVEIKTGEKCLRSLETGKVKVSVG